MYHSVIGVLCTFVTCYYCVEIGTTIAMVYPNFGHLAVLDRHNIWYCRMQITALAYVYPDGENQAETSMILSGILVAYGLLIGRIDEVEKYFNQMMITHAIKITIQEALSYTNKQFLGLLWSCGSHGLVHRLNDDLRKLVLKFCTS